MLRSRLLMAMMLMNQDNGDGGGGGGEPPPAGGEQPPPDQTQNQEQPPPPAPNPLETRLTQLEGMIMQLATQRAAPQQPGAPAPNQESETVNEAELHPELIKMNRNMQKGFSTQINRISDMLDNLQYQQQVSKANVPPEAAQMAEQMHASWKQSGMMVNGPNGPVAPTRSDALRFVLGDLAMNGKLPAQGKPPVPPHGGGQPPVRSGAPPVNITVNLDPTKMSRAERIAAQEKALDEEGF